MATKANAGAIDTVQDVELDDVSRYEPRGENILGGHLGIIKNVKVRLEVRVGDADVTVGELLELKEGSAIQLVQSVTSPVQVLLDGRIVALGELSVIGDNFGVRITELSS